MPDSFFDLVPTDDPSLWRLPLSRAVSVGPGENLFMFGGVGLAAAVDVLERTFQRPLVWASAQYLSFARPPATVELEVRLAAQGRSTTQARVTGRVEGAEIFTVNAALGGRPDGAVHQWAKAPDMPPPEACAPAVLWPDQEDNLNGRIEVRMAEGRYGQGLRTGRLSQDGRMVAWMRTRNDHPVDASLLAVFADYIPAGVGSVLGRYGGGNSLDNTLRVRSIVPTRWVLAEIRISGMGQGFAHGAAHLFAEDGQLMATASQSVVVRMLAP